jgi:hypothetical protein
VPEAVLLGEMPGKLCVPGMDHGPLKLREGKKESERFLWDFSSSPLGPNDSPPGCQDGGVADPLQYVTSDHRVFESRRRPSRQASQNGRSSDDPSSEKV